MAGIGRRPDGRRVEFFPSLTTTGTLYFNRASADSSRAAVYRSRLVDGARVSPDGRFLSFSATHYATAGGVWGKPRALDLVEELSLSSLRAFDAGPQNGRRDIYWIRSTIIEERRRERAP